MITEELRTDIDIIIQKKDVPVCRHFRSSLSLSLTSICLYYHIFPFSLVFLPISSYWYSQWVLHRPKLPKAQRESFPLELQELQSPKQ
jgi:hypothetical protein